MYDIRKPLDIERWGKLELWEAMDAAYIIGGTEPEYGPNATLTNIGTEVHKAMLAAIAIGTLKPYQKTESGQVYFLAAEVVKWAKEKGFELPAGLEAAVQATVLAIIARHRAAQAALVREGAISPESLAVWRGKDLWSVEELVALLCGVRPDSFKGTALDANKRTADAARQAIQRAMAAETLEIATWLQDEYVYEFGNFDAPESRPYFTPTAAIRWAEGKRAEFPKFPKFEMPTPAYDSPAPATIDSNKKADSAAASAIEPTIAQEAAGQEKDWCISAREIADELFDRDTANNCRDSLDGYCTRVMEKMQERQIPGSRGIITNHNTIKRDALQGPQWWQKKKK